MCKTKKPIPSHLKRFRDHGILSAFILLHQYYILHYSIEKIKFVDLPDRISRTAIEIIDNIRKKNITGAIKQNIYHAAAAIALHNVNIDIWDHDNKNRLTISLGDFKLDLHENPLFFLLVLCDTLQCWDRPERNYPNNVAELTLPSYDVRIICTKNEILWAVREDATAKMKLVSPDKELFKVSRYLTLEEFDVRSIAKEKDFF